MLRFLKALFTTPDPPPPRSTVRYVQPPQLEFSDLEHTFSKRTFGFHSYKEKLASVNPRLLHWIGSIDYSGHVREQCLRYLIDNYTPGDENRILLRLEDWVPHVQALATQWTRTHFCTLSLAQIDAIHRLLLYLSRKERLQRSESLDTINRCLLQKVEQCDKTQFYALNTNLRRYVYGLGVPGTPVLRRLMLYDKDPFNRLLLLKLFTYEVLTEKEHNRLKRDPSALVKRRSLAFLVESGEKPDQQTLTTYVQDRNRGVRAIARYYLATYYGIESYDLYKQRKDDAFYYIADYARKEDLDHFLEGMRSHKNRIRYLCLQAICHIDPHHILRLNPKQLIQENRRFRDLLCRHLPTLLSLEEFQAYEAILTQATPTGAFVYRSMLYRASFWHFIDATLSLLIADPSEENIHYLSHRFHAKPFIYEDLPLALEAQITTKIETLKGVQHHSLQTLLRDIAFAISIRRHSS